MKKENLSGDTYKGCSENGKIKACLNLLSRMCVIKQGQLEEWVVVKIGARTD